MALGVRAAAEGGADGVCVRGETEILIRALRESADRLVVDVSGVENSEQLRMLIKGGAHHAVTGQAEKVASELYRAAEEGAALISLQSVPQPD